MNPTSQAKWINECLEEVLHALVASEQLRRALIFKGARILNLHLREGRQSMDIDSTLETSWYASLPGPTTQQQFLEASVSSALRRHFDRQSPVRYRLDRLKVLINDHPRGWNGFELQIKLHDFQQAGVGNLPALKLDVVAPESLGPGAVETLEHLGFSAQVYSLHRIAGEKLRAYLTSLPAYRNKLPRAPREIRVKDLHDIARILKERPLTAHEFWTPAGSEFRLACQSRLVDCAGLCTFHENWSQARQRYESDHSLQSISFAEAEHALATVVGLFEQQCLFPLGFPIA